MSVVAQREARRVITFQKCGHTSVINMFMTPAGQSVARGATPAVRISGQPVPEVYKGFSDAVSHWPPAKVSIAVFRNPFERALSAYQHFIVRTLQSDEVVVGAAGTSKKYGGVPTQGRTTFTQLGFDHEMSFSDFVQHLGSIDLCYDKHLKPQAISFREAASGLVHGIQLEQLHVQWPLLVRAFDLPCTTEVAEFNAADYTADSDHWSYALVTQLYADDLKLWEKAHVAEADPGMATPFKAEIAGSTPASGSNIKDKEMN